MKEKNKKGRYGFTTLTCFMKHEAATKARKQNISSWRLVRKSRETESEWKGRVLGFWLTLLLAITSTANAAQAPDTQTYDIDIPAGNAAEALNQLAEQADVVLLFPYQAAQSRQANAVSGRFTLMEALHIMLQGSGLSGDLSENGTIRISTADTDRHSDKSEESDTMNTKKSVLAAVVGFLFGAGGGQGVLAQKADGIAVDEQSTIEEIVITATKRSASLQDTPMAVSALGSDAIEKRGIVGMDDYLRSLPGVSFQDRGTGRNQIIVRGMASDPQVENSTTGVYFGETPLTNLGAPDNGGGAGSVDIKMVDIERIEVLRGPQGSLYGAGSLGGTVRAIPVSPNLENFEGNMAVSYSQTGELGGNNNMVQGVINIPLVEDTLAVRGVAYRFDNSGYIENVAASQPILGVPSSVALGGVAQDRDDVGADEYTGFRLTTLWKPTDKLDITATYLNQKIEQDGNPEINISLSDNYQQVRLNTGIQGSSFEYLDNDVDVANLVLDYDFGWGLLTSSSSWTEYQAEVEGDISHVLFSPYFAENTYDQEIFVEELRLASNLEGPFQFLFGLYYEENDRDFLGAWPWSGSSSLDTGPFLENYVHDTDDQRAFFTELSYQLTEQWEITVGGRYFDYDKTKFQHASLSGTVVIDRFFLEKQESGETFKVNVTWTPNNDILLYGQWIEGFRAGRPERQPLPICQPELDARGIKVPDGVESDTTDNFEIGIKASLLDNRLIVNTAIYHIDWKGIPVNIGLPSCSDAVFLNTGESKSEGVEIELQAFITANLRLDVSTSYGEATLTEDAESIGSKGDNLPGSADFNFSAGLEYEFLLAGYDSFARIDYTYVGEYYHNVSETGEASGGYNQINTKVGIRFDKMDVDLFVNNLSNADDFTWVESAWGTNRAYRLRPRTVGLNLKYHF